jgi:hypothetical protein
VFADGNLVTTKIHELILVVSDYDELIDHLLYALEAPVRTVPPPKLASEAPSSATLISAIKSSGVSV